MWHVEILIRKKRCSSDCQADLWIRCCTLLYIQPQSFVSGMKIDKAGIFKNPRSTCPLAFEMFKQMTCEFKKLVAIRKSRKLKPAPVLHHLRRGSSTLEANVIV